MPFHPPLNSLDDAEAAGVFVREHEIKQESEKSAANEQ
jgi:hypothetical protein